MSDGIAKKREYARRAAEIAANHRPSQQYLTALAENICLPGECSDPVVFPSFEARRMCTARFRVRQTFEPSDVGDSPVFICQPSFRDMLKVSSLAVEPESAANIHTRVTFERGKLDLSESLSGDCNVEPLLIMDGSTPRYCFGLSSAAGVTFTAKLQTDWTVPMSSTYAVHGYDGSTFTQLASFAKVGPGYVSNLGAAGCVWSSTYTHYSLSASDDSGRPYQGTFSMRLEPTAGTWTCTPVASPQAVFASYAPDMSSIESAADNVAIKALSMLVTFTGADIDNPGHGVIANTDDDLVNTSTWYETVSALPIDIYAGRLKHGFHWHMPIQDYFAASGLISDAGFYQGICAIKGFTAGSITVTVDVIVNFITNAPGFSPVVAPSITGFSPLLRELRLHVPLVSDNASHVRKIKGAMSRAMKLAASDDARLALSELASLVAGVALAAGQPEISAGARMASSLAKPKTRKRR